MSYSSYHLTVAKTILGQLGGNRFVAMTGAKQFVAIEAPGLQFDLPKDSCFTKQAVCRVQVRLDPCDTYTVLAFSKKRGQLDFLEVSRQSGVYCDMLEDVFTDMTGLLTRL
ncbi:hypothetical protein MD588_24900 [Photobacterium sp. SDRW27]|uniref:hypothetical protein n=1 Tax=Photobacterium obscurum TaxID=2829490 RepID=UPI002242E726|nr:hypothetical protein [Photobacterium obscurum]MCW8332035.1 hypothetical protein [Photobacterium obscurum]